MQAGLLRKRITLQQRSSAVEPVFGQQVINWVNLATMWADIEAVSGQQLARSQSIYNETSHHITARYQTLLADIKTVGSYRILYGSRIFDLGAAMNEAERNRTVVLLASEGLNDGQ